MDAPTLTRTQADVAEWLLQALPVLSAELTGHESRCAAALPSELVLEHGLWMLRAVQATWTERRGQPAPESVVDGILAASAALDAVHHGFSPYERLDGLYRALVRLGSWSEELAELHAAVLSEIDRDERGGQQVQRVAPVRPQGSINRETLIDQAVGPLRKQFFQRWRPWCKQHGIDPTSPRAKELRLVVMATWYAVPGEPVATTLSNAPGWGQAWPHPRFWGELSDSHAPGSYRWLCTVSWDTYKRAVRATIGHLL